MEIEAETDKEAIRKARFFLGLNPNLETALEHLAAAQELLQRCADTEKEGADISYYINARACIKQIAFEAPLANVNPDYTDNVIPFSESYRRQR